MAPFLLTPRVLWSETNLFVKMAALNMAQGTSTSPQLGEAIVKHHNTGSHDFQTHHIFQRKWRCACAQFEQPMVWSSALYDECVGQPMVSYHPAEQLSWLSDHSWHLHFYFSLRARRHDIITAHCRGHCFTSVYVNFLQIVVLLHCVIIKSVRRQFSTEVRLSVYYCS